MDIKELTALLNSGAVFTAFDTETTGLKPESERVVEIGAIKFDKLGIRSRFNVLINPEKPMTPEAGKVNGITDAMLSDKPVFAAVAPDFLRYIQGTILVAHNAKFDLDFLNSELARSGYQALQNKAVDSVNIAKSALPGLGSYKLQFLAQFLNIQALEAHRAEDDARVCMEVFCECLKRV